MAAGPKREALHASFFSMKFIAEADRSITTFLLHVECDAVTLHSVLAKWPLCRLRYHALSQCFQGLLFLNTWLQRLMEHSQVTLNTLSEQPTFCDSLLQLSEMQFIIFYQRILGEINENQVCPLLHGWNSTVKSPYQVERWYLPVKDFQGYMN